MSRRWRPTAGRLWRSAFARRAVTVPEKSTLSPGRGEVVAFVEVKARDAEIDAMESVTPRQRQRIARAAEVFLAHHPDLADLECRFDVMLVTPGKPPRHIKDAWRPGF